MIPSMGRLTSSDLRLPRYQQLRDELAARIARQEWGPGEPVATEQDLARTYGIAVGTVLAMVLQAAMTLGAPPGGDASPTPR